METSQVPLNPLGLPSPPLILNPLIHFPQISSWMPPSCKVGVVFPVGGIQEKTDTQLKWGTGEEMNVGKMSLWSRRLKSCSREMHWQSSLKHYQWGAVLKQVVLHWHQLHKNAHDIMIISRSPGYCHGGMTACQGHVRTDTKPEQINQTVIFSATAGTERGKMKTEWATEV